MVDAGLGRPGGCPCYQTARFLLGRQWRSSPLFRSGAIGLAFKHGEIRRAVMTEAFYFAVTVKQLVGKGWRRWEGCKPSRLRTNFARTACRYQSRCFQTPWTCNQVRMYKRSNAWFGGGNLLVKNSSLQVKWAKLTAPTHVQVHDVNQARQMTCCVSSYLRRWLTRFLNAYVMWCIANGGNQYAQKILYQPLGSMQASVGIKSNKSNKGP